MKKVLIAALAAVVALAVVKGTWLGSHFRAWRNQAGTWAKNQVSPETEIQRLRHEVTRLEREDRICFDRVARQRLEVRECEARYNKDKAALTQVGDRIRKLRTALAQTGDSQDVVYNATTYSRTDAERQVDRDFDRFKPLKKDVEGQEKYLNALRKALQQNEDKLHSLRTLRQTMMTQLQELETELAQLRQAKDVDASLLDDSNYQRVQKDIETLKKRLEVEQEKLKLRGIIDRGPIEAAEETKNRKMSRQREIDLEFPVAPVASK